MNMGNDNIEKMLQELKGVFRDDQIKSEDLYRAIYGRDASYFNITPQLVVRPDTIVQVIELIRIVSKYGQGITFRSGGTSLSGQSLGSGVICELRTGWKGLQVVVFVGRVCFELVFCCA